MKISVDGIALEVCEKIAQKDNFNAINWCEPIVACNSKTKRSGVSLMPHYNLVHQETKRSGVSFHHP